MSLREETHVDEDDLIQYAMGNLSDTRLNNLTAHISLCGHCRDELANIQVALAGYSAAAVLEELPAGARDRFGARLRAEVTTAANSKQRQRKAEHRRFLSLRESLRSPLTLQIVSGLLAAGLLIVGFDDVGNVRTIHEMIGQSRRFQAQSAGVTEVESFLRSPDSYSAVLYTKPQYMKEPIGYAIYSERDRKLIFKVENMPAVPAGKSYALWILQAKGGTPVPAGVFVPNEHGSGSIILPELPSYVTAFGFEVTVEDRGGSAAPTTTPVLSGQ